MTRVLALVGPTASGKSDVAVDVARTRGAEIVAADAFTIYRGMDIGTAKPSVAIREQIAHHLVDVLDPSEDASVAWFQARAREAIADVRARGHDALLVGGSGLYLRAVVDDLTFPPTDPGVRARIRERFAERPEDAHAELTERDPAAAAKIDPSNLRRSVRALEVIELTGERFSSYDDAWDDYRSVYEDLDLRGIDRPTPELRDRIRRRAERMVEEGLLDEAGDLLGRDLSRTARQAIGYAEAFAVLRGDLAEEELVERIRSRTWRYAKRQRSWFRNDPRIAWASPDEILAAWT
ncbi:MAG: tRNA (adenosine(37)-N6)-dimethylallyltransferase MiaA [Actinobacteria bacterium]|nr:tRNA (adenosine(37)-N6)-dimethylallyltransferase MiaA [Actinomycetota bacterium]